MTAECESALPVTAPRAQGRRFPEYRPAEGVRWIWLAGADEDVDCHVLLRRSFLLPGTPARARLRITAAQSYRLWVNGRFAGRGPAPSDPAWQHYDDLEIAPLLAAGRNVLAVLAHNHGTSTHDLQACRGGFLCQLDLDGETLASDRTWKARRSARHSARAPRRFWSAGFAEVADMTADEDWQRADDDDGKWEHAEELGPHPCWPWERLVARPIPPFGGDAVSPASALSGWCDPTGAQAVSFDNVTGPGGTGIVHAACWARLPAGEARLRLDCDDAAAVFLDGTRLLAQELNPAWMRSRTWIGRDRRDQVHDGVNSRFGAPTAAVHGDGAWHRLVVAVDHGPRGWGFVLGCTPADGAARFLPIECRTRPEDGAPAGWELFEPLRSTGFADSLEAATPNPEKNGPGTAVPGLDRGGVTDPAVPMRHERRGGFIPSDPAEPLQLTAGRIAILDLGRVELGFPDLELEAGAGAVLDIGWSNLLPPDRSLRFAMGNHVKYADRLRLREGRQRWEPVHRRAFRYAHLCCRAGTIILHRIALRRHYCATGPAADFACSDPLLTRIHAESVHAARLLMQDRWQDCLRREMGTVNTQSFNYASLGAYLALGATDVTRHTLRTILRTRERSGWFDSHGLSGLNQDETTECLMYHLWVRDWRRLTGDAALAAELYPALADNLEYFLKSCRRDGLYDLALRHAVRTGEIHYLIDETNGLPGYGCPDDDGGPRAAEAPPTLLLGPNLLLAAAAQADAELAPEAGFPRHAARQRAIAARIRAAADRVFWDKEAGRYAGARAADGKPLYHHPLFDLYALRHGLAPETRRERLLALLGVELGPDRARRDDWPCSLLGSYHHLLEVFFANGHDRAATDLIRILFGAWLEHGGTAMPEGGKPAGLAAGRMRDDIEVHAYGLGALPLFHTRILGVQAAEPGCARVRIAPCPGGLGWAEGGTYTPGGQVHVSWRVEDGTFHCRVTAPAGIPVEIAAPSGLKPGRIESREGSAA